MYHPGSDTWVRVGNMVAGRNYHTATLLPSGKVLLAGAENSCCAQSSTELFDPATDTFTALPNMNARRADHGTVVLRSGKVGVVRLVNRWAPCMAGWCT